MCTVKQQQSFFMVTETLSLSLFLLIFESFFLLQLSNNFVVADTFSIYMYKNILKKLFLVGCSCNVRFLGNMTGHVFF